MHCTWCTPCLVGVAFVVLYLLRLEILATFPHFQDEQQVFRRYEVYPSSCRITPYNMEGFGSSNMEGFGNSDFDSDEHYSYGSVKDGYLENHTLEYRLKKKYWKTKQTVRQKLHKDEDEYIVAGDADIDAKLEKAHHLETSCSQLLRSATSNCYHIRALSSHELSLGRFLTSRGEADFTLAGDIMKRTGSVHEDNAKFRFSLVNPLTRLQSEMSTFCGSGLGDLSDSIRRLEKARADYRASLLWMKAVSEKFRNPDSKWQLGKFREAQANVKDTKENFDKLKGVLTEKIEMVGASRSNLLSHTLPYYQTEMLAYLDLSANHFHKLLTELRSQTQHQYKIKALLEEIRDLEVDDLQLENKDTPELGKSTLRDTPTNEDTSVNKDPSSDTVTRATESKNSDDDLFGLLQDELITRPSPVQKQEDAPPKPLDDIESQQMEDNVSKKDAQTTDLLSILDLPDENEEGSLLPLPSAGLNNPLIDEWDQYIGESQQDGGVTKDGEEDQGWSDEILQGNEEITDLQKEIDELLTLDTEEATPTNKSSSVVSSEPIFDPLLQGQDNSSSTENIPPAPVNTFEHLGLDPSLFQTSSATPTMPPPIFPQNMPLSLMQTTSTTNTGSVPRTVPVTNLSKLSGASRWGKGRNAGEKMSGAVGTAKEDLSKKSSWMNVFAHLDPIVNEKV